MTKTHSQGDTRRDATPLYRRGIDSPAWPRKLRERLILAPIEMTVVGYRF
jgi:hypothetical protein